MKKIDLTGKFKELSGETLKAGNGEELLDINIYLANSLAALQTKDPLRNLIIAKKIFENGKLELEKHDITFLKERVKEIQISDIMKSDILDRL